jgi:CspA family cold shock protein
MKGVRVQLVKYDMTKTKKRNRKDMIVDTKTEKAVIAQLERIHKGEQVVTIHEIIWDEKQINEVSRLKDKKPLYYGTVKFLDTDKGFGFIQPEEDMDDVFFHITACVDGFPTDRDRVEFNMSEGPKGLSAIHVRIINED